MDITTGVVQALQCFRLTHGSSKIRKFRLKTNQAIWRPENRLARILQSTSMLHSWTDSQLACVLWYFVENYIMRLDSFRNTEFVSIMLSSTTPDGRVDSVWLLNLQAQYMYSQMKISLNLFQTLFQNTSTWLCRVGLCFKWCHDVMTEFEFLALPCINKCLWMYHGIVEHLLFTKFKHWAAKSSPELSVYV